MCYLNNYKTKYLINTCVNYLVVYKFETIGIILL